MRSLIAAGALVGGVLAQNGQAWQQCGGEGFTGVTTCVSGYTCVYQNAWYSQCVPGTASSSSSSSSRTTFTTSTTTSAATTTTSSSTPTSSAGKFKFFGVNESGAEFGSGTYPGTWGKDFIFPDTSTIQTLIDQGYNAFRVTFAMERLVPNNMTGPFDEGYLANLTAVVTYITNAGAYAVVDPHNYGRYYGNIITDVAGFQTFWANVAGQFKTDSRAIFDTNNEYHDMDQTLVLQLNQAAIDGIRGAGATTQYIFAEGNSYSGAWTWAATNDNLASLTDPSGKLVYEMHQYLDSDGSGTSATCVNNTIGVDRVQSATAWLQQNGKLGVLGEYAGGANSVCQEAVVGMLDYLADNTDVWLGALFWAAGPWWGTYIYSFEPPSGTAYVYYDTTLESYIS